MKINQVLAIMLGALLVISTTTQAQSARDNTNFAQQQEHEQKMRLKKERKKAEKAAAEAAKAEAAAAEEAPAKPEVSENGDADASE